MDAAFTESTDWPPDRPGLRLLDASLRCKICGELYQGPVLLTCGHAFCSSCIRESIAYQVKQLSNPGCPVCRASCDETDLRAVPALREVLQHYRAERQSLIDMCKFGRPSGLGAASGGADGGEQQGNCKKRQHPSMGDGNIDGGGKRQKLAAGGSSLGAKTRDLKAPPKLCFDLLSLKELKARLVQNGLSAEGKKEELKERYQAFRRHIETAVDNGRDVTLKELLREFQVKEQRLMHARVRPARMDGLPRTTFKDMVWATRERDRSAAAGRALLMHDSVPCPRPQWQDKGAKGSMHGQRGSEGPSGSGLKQRPSGDGLPPAQSSSYEPSHHEAMGQVHGRQASCEDMEEGEGAALDPLTGSLQNTSGTNGSLPAGKCGSQAFAEDCQRGFEQAAAGVEVTSLIEDDDEFVEDSGKVEVIVIPESDEDDDFQIT
eukprot:evm.model.scf_1106.4 EVM.evm.TU.scf_1106.4   scf_1106:24257-26263(-)